MKMVDTVIPCSQFEHVFTILQIVNSSSGSSPMQDQYKVLIHYLSSFNKVIKLHTISISCGVVEDFGNPKTIGKQWTEVWTTS